MAQCQCSTSDVSHRGEALRVASCLLLLFTLVGCNAATVAQPIDGKESRDTKLDDNRRDSGPAIQTAKALKIERLPVPDDEAVAKSRKLLREIYGEEVTSATDDDQKIALAEKLLRMAGTSKQPADVWALLQAAKALAIDASDANLIHRVSTQIGRRFVADAYQEETEALLLLDEHRSLPEESAATARRLLALIPTALGRDDFERVQQLADAANRFATTSHSRDLAAASLQLLDELQTVRPGFLEAEEARRTLIEEPNDADANLKQGRFLCFVRGQWQAGLPMLAKGSDETLADLAKREANRQVDADEMLALGDAWWEYSDDLNEVLAKQVRLHAAHWYQRGLPKFEGLQRAKVEKRIGETKSFTTPLYDSTAAVAASTSTPLSAIPSVTEIPPPASPEFPFSADEARSAQLEWAPLFGLDDFCTTSKTGIKLVVVPAGEFLRGTPSSEAGRKFDEGPQHIVRITKPMLVGVYEITQREYAKVMGYNPSRYSVHSVPGVTSTSDFPVENITWFDACEFCNQLSEAEGLPPYYDIRVTSRKGRNFMAADVSIRGGNGYRLPTEAEWEYFARAGTTTPYPWGSVHNGVQGNQLGTMPYGTTRKGPALNRATSVGSYAPNAFGIYDLDGNVGEWCWDYYDPRYYMQFHGRTVVDPLGPDRNGTKRVIRSNSAQYEPVYGRMGRRHGEEENLPTQWTGLRVVRNP